MSPALTTAAPFISVYETSAPIHEPPPCSGQSSFVPIFQCTLFTSVHSLIASTPSSRPMPLCLYPPNGTAFDNSA
jgi:hypothetical protein